MKTILLLVFALTTGLASANPDTHCVTVACTVGLYLVIYDAKQAILKELRPTFEVGVKLRVIGKGYLNLEIGDEVVLKRKKGSYCVVQKGDLTTWIYKEDLELI